MQQINTMEDEVSNLEAKIIKAVELGIQFIMVEPGNAFSPVYHNQMNVNKAWTDDDFEKNLDSKLLSFKKATFIDLINKHVK